MKKPLGEEELEKVVLGTIEKELRREFPYGHPDFIKMCLDEVALHSEKNHDYAKGGDPMGNFARVANILKQYPGLDISKPEIVALIYLLKQLDAALWQMAKGHTAKVETPAVRWRDVSVYAKIIIAIMKEE
jgi:hypothetical protein